MAEGYRNQYERSPRDPEGFWAEAAGDIHFERSWDRVRPVPGYDVRIPDEIQVSLARLGILR